MFCRKCGKEIFDGNEYCEDCRNASQAITPKDNRAPAQRKKCCPKCKSRNMQIVTNSEYSSQTTGGGYSASKGCCGYIMLGPLGLLCGGCGNKSKTTVTSNSTTSWTCLDCGNKFRDIADIEKDIANETETVKLVPIALYITGAIFLFITLILLSFGSSDASIVIVMLFFAIFGISLIVGGKWIKQSSSDHLYALNEEKKEIEKNGYTYE